MNQDENFQLILILKHRLIMHQNWHFPFILNSQMIVVLSLFQQI